MNPPLLALFLIEAAQSASVWTAWEKAEAVALIIVSIGTAVIILLGRRTKATEESQDKVIETQTKLASSWEGQASLFRLQRDEAIAELERIKGQAKNYKENLDAMTLEYKELIQVDMQVFIENHKLAATLLENAVDKYERILEKEK